jgi:hypothetical protein
VDVTFDKIQICGDAGCAGAGDCVDSLACTQDVCTVEVHFADGRDQTWLLVRLPEPTPAGEPAKVPEINRTPPPVKPAASSK